jgi:hypothetical protein
MTKTITLGDWLKGLNDSHWIPEYAKAARIPGNAIVSFWENDDGTFTAESGWSESRGPTPEDALQALCEAYHRDPETLLDIGRSAKWTAAHGPDGVAGLCDGEAGVVVCRDGALHLVERVPYLSRASLRQLGFLSPDAPAAANERPRETSPEADASQPNTFETGLPAVYPNPPAEPTTDEEGELDAPEPSRAECLKASLESLLEGFLGFPTGSAGEDTMRTHLLNVLVEAVVYLLEQHDTKERT